MFNKKGFTLIEIIVVLVIVAIMATLAFPSYLNSLQRGAAKASQNNLVAIYNAEKNYYFTNNSYCLANSAASAACIAQLHDNNCADNLNAINCNLSLNIADNYFGYQCVTDATGFSCVAKNNTNANFTLTAKNDSIILTGGTGCTSSTGAYPPCNPACVNASNPSYCPI